jgi:protein-tyrosine-phosphatase
MLFQIYCKISKRLRVLLALRNAVADTERHLSNIYVRNILVLCYGNIYRSPLVAQYLRDNLGQEYEIRSAGFYPKPERPSPESHINMCRNYNIDLINHKSAIITKDLADWADAIIIMDRHNYFELIEFGDEAIRKVVWLGAVLNEKTIEINDPYGKSLDEAEDIVKILLNSSQQLVNYLNHN